MKPNGGGYYITDANPRADQVGCPTLAFLIFPRMLAPIQTPETLATSPLLPTPSPNPAHSASRGLGQPGIFQARKSLGELQTPHWGPACGEQKRGRKGGGTEPMLYDLRRWLAPRGGRELSCGPRLSPGVSASMVTS